MSNIVEIEDLEYRRGTVVDREEYKIDIEYFHGEVFLHLLVDTFSPSIYKRIKEDFKYIKQLAYEEGFDYIHAYTPNLKFAKKMGEVEHLDTVEINSQTLEVIRWAC